MSSSSRTCRWAFSLAMLASGLPALAHEPARVDERGHAGRGAAERHHHDGHQFSPAERDRRIMDAYERQRRIEAYEASQGGRSRPGSPGDQPYNNPRPPDTPMPLLQRNPYRK